MKKVSIKKEVMETIVSKVAILKSPLNRVRFAIGVRADGDGLASIATIVNGGCMADIGFKTSLPKGGEVVEIPDKGAWAKFAVSANDFCSYAGALLGYDSDITLCIEDACIKLAIGSSIVVPIKTVADTSSEALLQKDYKDAVANISATDKFLGCLSRGGYIAQDKSERPGLSDRVFLAFENSLAKVYSVSGCSAAKAVTPIQMVATHPVEATEADTDPKEVLLFLKEAGMRLADDKKAAFAAELQAIKGDASALFAKAKELGFEKKLEFQAALTAVNFGLLCKLFAGAEKLSMMLTPKNLHIASGFMKVTFALAEEKTSSTIKSIDMWEKNEWVSKVVLDRDNLMRDFKLLQLGEMKSPVLYKATKAGLKLSKDDVVTHVALTDKSEGFEKMEGALSVTLLKSAVDHLAAGNIIVRFLSESSPISLSNGDLTESGITSYHYIVGVNIKAARPKKETKEETPAPEADGTAE